MTNKSLIEISGKDSQLIVELGDFAEILHWGVPVRGDLANFRVSLQRPVPYGRLDDDVAMSLSLNSGAVFSAVRH